MKAWLLKLLDAIEYDEDVAEWLTTEQPDLEGRSPLQAVGDGDGDQVAALVDRVIDGHAELFPAG